MTAAPATVDQVDQAEPAPPPARGVTYADCIDYCDSELIGIEAWESVARREGKPLAARLVRHRAVLRTLRSLAETVAADRVMQDRLADVVALRRRKAAEQQKQSEKNA